MEHVCFILVKRIEGADREDGKEEGGVDLAGVEGFEM